MVVINGKAKEMGGQASLRDLQRVPCYAMQVARGLSHYAAALRCERGETTRVRLTRLLRGPSNEVLNCFPKVAALNDALGAKRC